MGGAARGVEDLRDKEGDSSAKLTEGIHVLMPLQNVTINACGMCVACGSRFGDRLIPPSPTNRQLGPNSDGPATSLFPVRQFVKNVEGGNEPRELTSARQGLLTRLRVQ
jgi:hypothetical protein